MSNIYNTILLAPSQLKKVNQSDMFISFRKIAVSVFIFCTLQVQGKNLHFDIATIHDKPVGISCEVTESDTSTLVKNRKTEQTLATHIPDTNFATAIRLACSTCIDANNDLTADAAGLFVLNIHASNIVDLMGIDGFTNLNYIFCSQNQITSIPTLPKRLQYLDCSDNQIKLLPALPSGLTSLYCEKNLLQVLPTLPATLTYLKCSNNQLHSLPVSSDGLPNIGFIYCSYNQLQSLPDLSKSKNLAVLWCDHNQLKTLPDLPSITEDLNCSDNQLQNLPALPHSLSIITCHNNNITCLPTLSGLLGIIQLDADKIVCLPNKISATIYDANFNSLNLPVCGILASSVIQPGCATPTGTITITPQNGATYSFDGGNTFQSNNIKSGLSSGTYNIGVKLSKTSVCASLTSTVIINPIASKPSVPIFSITPANCSASDGIITITAPNDGVLYSFNGGNTYQKENIKLGLSPNTYSLIVKDASSGTCFSDKVSAVVNSAVSKGLHIPDDNFAAAIRRTCNSCIDACNNLTSAASTQTYLYASYSGIKDLTGIEGFPALTDLQCGNNQLSVITYLPLNLTNLFCSNNQLSILPALPKTLTTLQCDNNKLKIIPDLPTGLSYINCSYNELSSLPALNNIQNLVCYNNRLTSLPTLPNNLQFLNCSNNQLLSLPSLPNGFQTLYCNGNNINCLPTLPATLSFLMLDRDKIYCLPNSTNANIYDTNYNYLKLPVCGNVNATVTQPDCITSTATITIAPQIGATYSFNGGSTFQKENYKSGLITGNYALIVKNTVSTCGAGIGTVIVNEVPIPPAKPTFTVTPSDCSSNYPNGSITINSPSTDVLYSFDGGNSYEYFNNKKFLGSGTYKLVVKDIKNANCFSEKVSAIVEPKGTTSGIHISDPNFAAAIRMYYNCPSCIDPCNNLTKDAANLKNLYVNYSLISDLMGIEGFTGLDRLYCNNNLLQTLPAMPNSITYLDCSNNQLKSIVSLPNNLQTLYCSNNQLSSLPTLPSNLISLYCYNNNISCLPFLPALLHYLIIDENKISCVPNDVSGLYPYNANYEYVYKPLCENLYAPQINIRQPDCSTPTGIITISPREGATYSFDGGKNFTSEYIKTDVKPGQYTVFVKYSSGCIASASIIGKVWEAPNVPSVPNFTTIPPTCTLSTGTITITFPTTNVMYSFDGGTKFQDSNFKNGLLPDTYKIVVKDKATGCTSSILAKLEIPKIDPPTISALPEPTTINCPTTPTFTTPKAKDFFGLVLTPTYSDKITAGNCSGNYSITRTWTATDGCGKTSMTSQTITVQDISSPVIAPLPKESTIDCPLSPVFAQATANDACGSVNLSFKDVTTVGNSPNAYTITRTWTAADACGNSAAASQIIRVRDMDQPYIYKDGAVLIASQGTKYQWYSGEVPLAGETNQSFYPTTFGDYKVKVTNALGCSRFSEAVHSDADFVDNCPQIHKNFGQTCDDGNPKTINDRVRNDCKCRGDYYSPAIATKCPTNINVVSTDKYGTVVTWNERDMFSSVAGYCNLPNRDINVQRTSGYYAGYPFPVNTLTYEEYVATDACGNKSSCSFYVRTSDIVKNISTAPNNTADSNSAYNSEQTGGAFALYQNIPNPTASATKIGFNLPGAQSARLTIINMSGQILFQKNMDGHIGYNEITIDKSELNASGVLQYRLDTQDNSATKRMVVTE